MKKSFFTDSVSTILQLVVAEVKKASFDYPDVFSQVS